MTDPFDSLRRRLLLSYLAVIIAILSVSAIAVYQVFARNLFHQIDRQLLTLGEAAALSLEFVKHEHQERSEDVSTRLPSAFSNPPSDRHPDHEKHRVDRDGDVDFSWQDLQEEAQGVEWFDAQQTLLAREGTLFPSVPLRPDPGERVTVQTVLERTGNIHTLTLAIYNQQQLQGYVRMSESTIAIDSTLASLRRNFVLGGFLVLGLAALSSRWLTRQATRPVESSFQKLKQFTADASHELRNPLTVVKTSIEVMQSHPERIHPDDRQKINAIASATEQMAHLVEDLLLLTRLDITTRSYTQEPTLIPLDELLDDVVDEMSIPAEAKNITLQVNLGIEALVLGDSHQLGRLFRNLLQNAIQYTPSGGTIVLKLIRQDHTAIVSIQDTGIGIAASDLPFIFDRFWRADKARSRWEGGMGMGLAIAQGIAQAHNGSLTVTSELGQGSCFAVRLPL